MKSDNTPNLRETVVDRLRDDIVSGNLRPGSPLRDLDLAERYGTSTSPVREALHQLATERLIEMPANRQKRVAPLDKKTSMELVAVFCVLATAGYSWGAPRLNAEGIRTMRNICEAQRRAVVAKDHHSLGSLLWRFHDPVFIAADNEELRRMLASSFSWLKRLITLLRPKSTLTISQSLSAQILEEFQHQHPENAINLFKLLLDNFQNDVNRMPNIY